jgi:2'-5' RNA ligase
MPGWRNPLQGLLPGVDREHPDRLFFALFPEAGAAASACELAEALRREYGLQDAAYAADRLHVSLAWLGDFDGLPRMLLEDALAAAAEVAQPCFRASFSQAGSFRKDDGKRPLVLIGDDALAPVTALRQRLLGMLRRRRPRLRQPSGFKPHVTLLRDSLQVPMRTICPIAWTVRDFALVHSRLRRTRYEILGRWRLPGVAAA